METAGLDLDLLDLVTADMDATIAFYRALGVTIPDSAIWRTPSGAHHVDLTMPGGLNIHFDSPALAKVYNKGWRKPTGAGSRVVIGFKVPSRDAVDRKHLTLTELGHRSVQPPYDTFWGARYAILQDPDGNHVGIMSPPDPARRTGPPAV
ncbi:MAG TPA: VOC family protein [Pseudomonadales bacterium]